MSSPFRYGAVTVTVLDERESPPSDDLVHTCAEHPFADQACHGGCRAFCGCEWDMDDVIEFVGCDVTPDYCVVCESMCDARYGAQR